MRRIPFSKYHGCGNDFVIIDGRDARDAADDDAALARLATAACDRHTGIGADGLILVKRNPLEMVIFNSDGSEAPMCGNGIRCFAHYCRDEGIVPPERDAYIVRTLAGDMRVGIRSGDPFCAEINMGRPDFRLAALGVDAEDAANYPEADARNASSVAANTASSDRAARKALSDAAQSARETFLRRAVHAADRTAEVSSVFMGTVHTVVWTDANGFPETDASILTPVRSASDGSRPDGDTELVRFARALSEHPLYREKTNVNMARIVDESNVEVVTWERGAGLTAACGTGASAVAVIGALEGRLKRKVRVLLSRDALTIEIADDGAVSMAGPSVRVAKGTYYFHRDAGEENGAGV
ncbi:MAG: diaminopimelate epimerase [Clostridiales Family XIII bacterium]|jgi:diaminopimelate epimerase|nr:diaminopimelate epimerase [Clostridiales Family XIII bacterium]